VSEHERTSRSTDVLDVALTDADLERAFGRTMDRGRHLVRRRNQRRTALGVLGAAVLLAGGFGVISSLSDDTPVVVTPAGNGGKESGPTTSTTNASPGPTSTVQDAPMGFVRSETGIEGILRIDNTTPPMGGDGQAVTTTILEDGTEVGIDSAASATRGVPVTGAQRTGDHSVVVSFECDPAAGYLDHVIYRLQGSTLQVQIALEGVTDIGCTGDRGVELFFPDEVVPADVRAEATIFE